jgi:hypothetical protein
MVTEMCLLKGGSLVTIFDNETNLLIMEMTKSVNQGPTWLSLKREVYNNTQVWTWDDERVFSFTQWANTSNISAHNEIQLFCHISVRQVGSRRLWC